MALATHAFESEMQMGNRQTDNYPAAHTAECVPCTPQDAPPKRCGRFVGADRISRRGELLNYWSIHRPSPALAFHDQQKTGVREKVAAQVPRQSRSCLVVVCPRTFCSSRRHRSSQTPTIAPGLQRTVQTPVPSAEPIARCWRIYTGQCAEQNSTGIRPKVGRSSTEEGKKISSFCRGAEIDR